MISKLIILCIVATTTLADMMGGEEEFHQGMTGGEEDYHPSCDDGTVPICPDGSAVVLGAPCDDGKPVCGDGSIARPGKHGKHGKHDKHGKHGKHGKHDKHGKQEDNDQNPVDAQNHVAENNQDDELTPPCDEDDDDCEERHEHDTWYHFAHKQNTTEAEKKQRMKRDGHVGLIGLVVGVVIGYVGSKCCCCCKKCKKKNPTVSTVSGELVVLGSISPKIQPSAPIRTSVYSANAIV